MNAVWDAIGRAVVAFIWGPVDRTVCRFATLTDSDER